MKKHILIVNGYPTCGKTTFNNIVKEFCMAEIFSSIEPINHILKEIGWDGCTKDEKYRNFASILKAESTKFNDYSYHKVCEKIEEFLHNNKMNDFLLIDIREPDEIEKIKLKYPLLVKTIFIQNDNRKIDLTNESDKNVADYYYDYYIDNNDTLEELRYNIQVLLADIGEN